MAMFNLGCIYLTDSLSLATHSRLPLTLHRNGKGRGRGDRLTPTWYELSAHHPHFIGCYILRVIVGGHSYYSKLYWDGQQWFRWSYANTGFRPVTIDAFRGVPAEWCGISRILAVILGTCGAEQTPS